MKKLLILGSGAGGVMVATKMRKKLDEKEWSITIIDRSWQHHYQAGWLFVPFGIYTINDCIKPQTDFVPKGVTFVQDEITNVDPAAKRVTTAKGKYEYDWLVIATGCRIAPDEIEGMEDGWGDDIHNFYTPDGAVALAKKLKHFEKGKLVLNIAEMPIKCPVAPLEFVFLADWFFSVHDTRCNIEIELVTPLTGAFTKPVAAQILGKLCEEKNITITPSFEIGSVDVGRKVIESHKGEEVNYDLMIAIPPNLGSKVIMDSEIGDVMGYVNTDHHTLKAKDFDNVYIIGDATNVPTSKAGSVAHYESDIVCENLEREIEGLAPLPEFDGHSTCFIVTGYEKSTLIDFNYKVEPLPGKYPFPGVGPFDLLGETFTNYWGKMMFKWVYFNLMLKGKELPLEPQMFMAGKKIIGACSM
ncbi:Pyridine nucleotide-disulfide oxidoreductase, FAD/NAD(P)-binding domain containing protein [Alkalidesulfovibrio alkalitolerans DSM 16529]|uniref:Pyridine nucleotide-disulfide oxidoreductase, FAD/NAD(P)-binding domain containing protein n=1 Tax=Alkalidesulfovibrio alkalitolerans DSM 16529 TaxID=1121439 RepID=S7T2D5_9BACT|nr:FAD/NAD(P)-binding oxidoreductase [Alkalidesulfovibrio alkalitolerans]EPR30741.1 Pyridine nucleotide-disulfide oxidoreductase, FAD/NAD(P)-binding domain containing protein [Alkalidesulfovibrio alkalitolerans DSM 16529]